MELENILQLRDKAYSIAKSKGFYKTAEHDDSQYITAIHEELSEAFCAWNKHKGWITNEDEKPDGVYYELTDAVIRLLSFCGYKGIYLAKYNIETNRPYDKDDLCDVINKSHLAISQYYELLQREVPEDDFELNLTNKCTTNLLSQFIARIEIFIFTSSDEDYTLQELIENKLSYNISRPEKHGGNEV